MSERKGLWHRIRKLWATLGMLAVLVFASWSFLAYRASAEAHAALVSDGQVKVHRGAQHWSFKPVGENSSKAALVFFPGALVEPAAYAPLLRQVALAGYEVLLVEVPFRGMFGGADGSEVIHRARRAMLDVSSASEWVLAGHSRGGAVAARFARESASGVGGLVLLGTSHPRDFSLEDSKLSVTKVLGTRDGVSSIEKSEANRHLLPAAARWVLIKGGNHSQFGSYGFQPGDRFATVDRDLQQELTCKAIVAALESIARENAPAGEAVLTSD